MAVHLEVMIHYCLSLCDFDLLTSELCRVTRVLVKCFQFSHTRTHTPPFLLFHGDFCWASFPERELLEIIKLGFCRLDDLPLHNLQCGSIEQIKRTDSKKGSSPTGFFTSLPMSQLSKERNAALCILAVQWQ